MCDKYQFLTSCTNEAIIKTTSVKCNANIRFFLTWSKNYKFNFMILLNSTYKEKSTINQFPSEYQVFCKQVLWQTVKTQMKCPIMGHFIRLYTACLDINNLQGTPWNTKYTNLCLLYLYVWEIPLEWKCWKNLMLAQSQFNIPKSYIQQYKSMNRNIILKLIAQLDGSF